MCGGAGEEKIAVLEGDAFYREFSVGIHRFGLYHANRNTFGCHESFLGTLEV